MKCKHCNGTGKVRGYFYEKTGVNKWEKVWGDSPCDECGGTGKIQQTNEEWFCSLPTKEKAHFLSVECARAMCEQQLKITNRNGVDYWNMWLKQPHH